VVPIRGFTFDLSSVRFAALGEYAGVEPVLGEQVTNLAARR
jgi:hypothetical protein